MMNKTLLILTTLLTSILLTFGGVSALWSYAEGTPEDQINDYACVIEDYYYPENVPDDDEHELSHNTLLQKIVSNDDGLNNSNSLLSKALDDRINSGKDDVSSNQQVTGGNLKNKFSNVEGFENVGFLIYFYSDTEYYIYTFKNEDTGVLDRTIEVFMTKVIYRNGQWTLSGGYQGTAEVCEYDDKTNGPYKNTINHLTWVRKE